MTTKKKLLVAVALFVAIASTVSYSIIARNRGVVLVETKRVSRQDLTQTVTASGEIKPKKYVNISSNAYGRIVHLPVKEGDRVDSGDLLLRLESVQSQSEVRSAEASLEAAMAEFEGMDASVRSSEAAVNTARAEQIRTEADFRRAQQNFTRAEQLNRDGLISTEQYERQKAEFEISTAQINAARARVSQSEAQLRQILKQKEGVSFRVAQQRAILTRARDQLSKTTILSPLTGVITHLPVNEGEMAIVGVQNQPGTVLMTIADMSVITAEVKVDETDIVNVKLGQRAEVRVDALPDRVLTGRVSEVGNSALTRTGGLTTNPVATSQEAKDFKVVITLDTPPVELRPGLSCSATIVTASRQDILTIPIQALTVREIDEIPPKPASAGSGSVLAAPPNGGAKKKVEKQGVFVVGNGIAFFRPVKMGIMGSTETELIEGLAENEEIVTGSYKVLRTLQDNTRIRIEQKKQ